MSSLFTSLLGGNLIANRQASSAAKGLNANAQQTLAQQNAQNQILAQQEQLYGNMYNQALAQASSILGKPVLNAGKLTGLKAVNKTGPLGDTSSVNSVGYSLLGG